MGGIFGNIINFIASPIGWIVIVGLVGGIGRLANWIGQERAKRTAIQARARRESEALRTGRPSAIARAGSPAPPPPPADAEQRQRALQEQRTAQLRALQQKRLAELRAKRAAGQGGVSTPAPPAPGRPAPTPKTRPSPKSTTRPVDRSRQTSERPIQPQQAARSERFVPKQTPIALERAPALAQPFRPVAPPTAARPVEASEIGGPASRAVGEPAPIVAPLGIGTLAALRHDIKRAVMIAEALGPPVCDRDPDKLGAF